MAGKYVRFDWALKHILRQKENFEILEGFVSELIKEDVKIQKILESESNKAHEDEKMNRVDMLVENSKGHLMLVEIQNSSEIDYFQRIVFGSSRLICDYLDEGQSYGKIKKVITIHIVYFDLGQGSDYLYKGSTKFFGLNHPEDELQPSVKQREFFNIDQVSQIFPEHYIIKVKKFKDETISPLDEWIYFLKNGDIKPDLRAKGLAKAQNRLDMISLNMKDRDAYRVYVKQLRDEASYQFNKEFELQEMKQEGIVEGKQEAKAECYQRLLASGMSEEQARKLSGLE